MGLTKSEFKTWIRRKLGEPMVKVELHDVQLDAIINSTKKFHQKWALGSDNQETYFIIRLESGKSVYDLPEGLTEIMQMYDYSSSLGNANELFTLENYMWNMGLLPETFGPFSLVGYHASLAYLKDLRRYLPSKFHWLYIRGNNTLKLNPVPDEDQHHKFIMLHCYMAEQYTVEGFDEEREEFIEKIYEDDWFQKYCLAEAKITLGLIRRKFANFTSIGNTGIQLDGDSLISEGNSEKEKLEEQLKNEEVWNAYYPLIG
jgi:hypothetical protein